MLRPIQVAPLSQRQMISQNPLVPNTVSGDQYLTNQFASGNFAQPAAMAMSRPAVQAAPQTAPQTRSPVQAVQPLQAPQRARFQKRIAESPAVEGLLGGQQSAGGLLDEIQGQASRQGLYTTLMAMGRTLPRGENRYMSAVQAGQEAKRTAQTQGLQDLSTRLKLEEIQRARLKEDRDRQQEQLLNAYIMGAPVQGSANPAQPLPEGTTKVLLPNAQQKIEENTRSPIEDTLAQRYDPYEIGTLTDAEQQDAVRAMRLERAAEVTTDSDLAAEYRERAKAINDRIGAKFLPREKRTTLSYDRRDQWDKTEYRPRVEQVAKARQLAELAKNPNAITDISLIFGLMKSLDPRSTVRDGEADMVANAAGAFNTLMNFGNQIAEGRSLPNTVYPEIVESALMIANAVERDYQAAVNKRLSGIEEEGLNADIVVPYRTLNAPDVEAEVTKIRQIVDPNGGTSNGNAASALKSIKTRGGVGQ